MKYALPILSILWALSPAMAQEPPDPIPEWATSAAESLDSLRLDSLSFDPLPDSVVALYQKADSIRQEFNTQVTELQKEYTETTAAIDQKIAGINHTIDSLGQLNLPTEHLLQKRDSLAQLIQQTESKFTSKLDALKSKTTEKLDGLDLPPEYKEPLTAITSKMDAINLNSGGLPNFEIDGYSLDLGVEGIGNVTDNAPNIGKLGEVIDAPDLDKSLGEVGEVTEQLKGYQEDISNITEGNLDEVKALPETIEQKAAEHAGISELEKGAGELGAYQEQLEALGDAESAKEKAVETAKKVAIDHFAGKEEKLKAAMEQMAKYKQRYSSVQSIKDLPKRPPNAMKGKPFVERLVPGLFFQFQQRYYNLFDFNPSIGYRISRRFTAGAGWNQRVAYDRRRHAWSDIGVIYGPRVYVDFRLKRGFIAHIDSELMNTFVPSVIGGNPEVGHREWVWGMMTGIKKEYKVYKNLRGTVLLQYNLFNRKFKAPYADRLNSRIGVEYQIKKRKRKERS